MFAWFESTESKSRVNSLDGAGQFNLLRSYEVLSKTRFIACLIIPVLCFGCVRKHLAYPVDPGARKIQLEVIRDIISRPSKISSVSAFAKVYVSMEGKKRRVKEVILIDRVGNMRFESLNPFGQTSLLLIKKGSRVFFHNLMENTYMFLREQEPVLDMILGVPISLEDVREVIFQDFSKPVTGFGGADIVVEGDIFIVEYQGHYKKFRLTEEGTIESVKYFDYSGRTLFSVSYLKYVRKNDIQFPRKIQINFPKKEIELGFNFKDVSINEEIDMNSFVFSIPQKASRLR